MGLLMTGSLMMSAVGILVLVSSHQPPMLLSKNRWKHRHGQAAASLNRSETSCCQYTDIAVLQASPSPDLPGELVGIKGIYGHGDLWLFMGI